MTNRDPFDMFDLDSAPAFPTWLIPSSRVESPHRDVQRWDWTVEEDLRLKRLAKQFSKDWNKIAEFFPSKTVGNIKKRYLNKHNPNMKRAAWSQREDELIVEMYANQGCSWTTIAEHLEGRQPDAIKNRFYGTLRKKMPKDPLDMVAQAFFDEEELRGLTPKEKLERVEQIGHKLESLERVLHQAKQHISQLKTCLGASI